MDPICHTLVGANLAETGLRERTALGTATLIIAANAPDIDVLSYVGGSTTALAFRRGVTHGVLAWLILPLVLTGLVVAWDRLVRRRRGRRPQHPVIPTQVLVLAFVGVLSHPLLDFLNTYGIRLLMPFSHKWFYGDTLFIVDPWVWAMLAGGYFVARRRRSDPSRAAGGPRGRPARWALGVMVAYVALLGASGLAARAAVRAQLPAQAMPSHLMVAPVPVNPLRRWVVYEVRDTIHYGTFNWLHSPRFAPEPDAHAAYPSSAIAATVRDEPEVQKFLGWARFPYANVVRSADGDTVQLVDGRYSIEPGNTWAAIRIPVAR